MAELSDFELDEIYAFAKDLGKKAGAMLLDAAMSRCRPDARGVQGHEEKDNAVDLVTQTDEGRKYPC
jgi:myo-inositol-1(or 4)-monophosphatase